MKHICVFCSAQDLADEYKAVATKFGKLLVERGYGLVWGGSNTGLMKVLADSVAEQKGHMIGVSMKLLEEVIRPDISEAIIAENLGERKKIMLERADALVALIGGLGTLDEVSQMLEMKKLGLHNKPIVILNTNHFYDGLLQQIERMFKEGFIKGTRDEVVAIVETPEEALEYISAKLAQQPSLLSVAA